MPATNFTRADAAPHYRRASAAQLEQRFARLAGAVAAHELKLADLMTNTALPCITRQRVLAAGRAQSAHAFEALAEARTQFIEALAGLR
jgi:hypothetical protein